MWVEKIKNEKGKVTGYKYVERFEDPLTGKMRQTSMNHTKNTKSVEEEMLILLNEKFKTILDDPMVTGDISFGKLIDEWLPIHLQTVRGQTKIIRKVHANIFKEKFSEVRVSKITAELLNRYLLTLTQAGLAHQTVKGYRASLSSILKFGKKFGYFKSELWKELHVEKVNVSKPDRDKYLEDDEAKTVLENMEKNGRDELARLCRIQLLTGMRIGELVAIDYLRQVDFEARAILIDQTYNADLNAFSPLKVGI